jgi:hypothetical protein
MDKKNMRKKFLAGAAALLFSLPALFVFGMAGYAHADNHHDSRHQYRDSRYHLDRSYPARGTLVQKIPRNHHIVLHKGARYYFHEGVWYRPQGPRFSIVTPPLGLFVHFLPPCYATIWVRGVPFYYANEVYYTHDGNGYKVAAPPEENAVSQAPPPASQLFIYPRNKQDEKQQADDRYQCHAWAVSQTNYDPTQPQTGSSVEQRKDRHADYLRAMSACLDGRGYTVK